MEAILPDISSILPRNDNITSTIADCEGMAWQPYIQPFGHVTPGLVNEVVQAFFRI
jgi:hypothetical protein